MRTELGRCTFVRHTTRYAIAIITLSAAGTGLVRAQSATTTTFQLTALASGNWNAAGVHTVSNYQIGYSTEQPNQQVAYFEFDLDPIKGRTVVEASALIPGSTDYSIGSTYAPRCGTAPCFKVGIVPQGTSTLAEIVSPTSNNNTNIYTSGNDANRNQDLGYEWVENGLHPGEKFNAFTYNTQRLQAEVNAGGDWVFWGRDAFSTGSAENYIWGDTAYNTGIVLIVTVSNGAATTAVVQSGTYQIENLNSAMSLEIPAGQTANGTLVDQATDVGTTNQRWNVTRLSSGNYTIANAATGQLLDVLNSSTASGGAIDVKPADAATNQQWTFTGTNGGNYTIKSVSSGLLIGSSGALTLSGTLIDQFTANGIANQQWSFH
ncbi:RICIN domain-containing protein [Bradyrhizobium sp.]|uniref:RICIN domain-containing protein n=1 Tax=Bradyrhizobium sp. TaxID=376 RepID=UPI003C241A74